jgi:hypothetical protein
MPNAFGDTGNRWWVGWNHNQGNRATFPSLSGPNGYEAFPSGSAADDAAIVAAGLGTDPALATGPGVVSLHNILWSVMGGPYPTKAAAVAAIPGIQAAHPAPGALSQAAAAAGAGSPIADVTSFLSRLTALNTWIRVGEFVLGALLLIAGALHLSGQSADLRDIAKLTPIGKVL